MNLSILEYLKLDKFLEVHTITQEQIMNPGGKKPIMATPEFLNTTGIEMTNNLFKELSALESHYREEAEPCYNVSGFKIMAKDSQEEFCGIIFIWTDSYKLVGGLRYGTPYVLPEYRGQRLGTCIQLKAFETGIKRIDTDTSHFVFSKEGLASRKSAHKLAVKLALEQGKSVRLDVLKDYPDLIK